jgi:hypothetical protein
VCVVYKHNKISIVSIWMFVGCECERNRKKKEHVFLYPVVVSLLSLFTFPLPVSP